MRADSRLQRKTRLLPALVLVAAIFATPLAGAQDAAGTAAPTVVADPALEAEVMELSHKLRCLVCQNQSIAESNAPLAIDLRNQVREQLAAGRSQRDVLGYLVDRYGDFVLYEPPLKATTLLLWGGPALFLFGAAGWLVYRLRRRVREAAEMADLSEAERRRARDLLADPSGSEPTRPSSATLEPRK